MAKSSNPRPHSRSGASERELSLGQAGRRLSRRKRRSFDHDSIWPAPVIALLAKGHEQRVSQIVIVRLRIAGDADGDLRLRDVEPEGPMNPVPPREHDAEV